MFKKPGMYLRDSIIFPNAEESSLLIGRVDSKKAINAAMASFANQICIITQTQGQNETPGDDEIFPVGTVCEIIKCLNFSDGTKKILIKGIKPFNLFKISYDNGTRIIEGEEFEWPTSCEKIEESQKSEFYTLLRKYNPSWKQEGIYENIFDLDDFILKTSHFLSCPYLGIQMKDELENVKRDLDYWKTMKKEQFIDFNSRIGRRIKLLTALPSRDKLQIIKDILVQESADNL